MVNSGVGAVVGLPEACKEVLEHKNKPGKAVLQLSRRTGTDQSAEDQAQIERADVNQLAFENILVTAQMSSPHGSGFVTMSEAPLDQLASLAQQALAMVA